MLEKQKRRLQRSISRRFIKREPRFISLEDLNISGMMKNKHLSKAVQRQGFYEFRRQIEYECGNVIDKDYQGALNLKKYGEMFLKQQSVA